MGEKHTGEHIDDSSQEEHDEQLDTDVDEQEDDASSTEGDDGDRSDDENADESKKSGFDGKFDAPRARRTIDTLREENRKLKAKKAGADTGSDDLRRENLQLQVALETGLTAKQAKRLQGNTREEMLDDAADLFDSFAPEEKEKPRRSQQPRPKLRGGSSPQEEPEKSPADIAKGIRI